MPKPQKVQRPKEGAHVRRSPTGYSATLSKKVDSRFLKQQRILEFTKALVELQKVEPGWDSYRGCAPNDQAIGGALSTAVELAKRGVFADRIAPTDEGGVVMEYVTADAHYFWEFEEDGDIGLLVRYPDNREVSADLRRPEIPYVIARFHHG